MNKSYIYIIGNNESNIFKVGYSRTPYKRLRSLQTGNPISLEVLWCQELNENIIKSFEREIHKLILPYQTKGEWFKFPLDLIISEIKFLMIKNNLN